MTVLRDYQARLERAVYDAWAAGARNVVMQLPTGGGKSATFAHTLSNYPGASCVLAHRQEIVAQISLALARYGVRHRLIASRGTVRTIIAIHMAELGRSYYEPNARCTVAGVDTLVRMDAADPWFACVGLLVQDEGHHVLRANKWGRVAAMFPNAYGLLPTATPARADGRGLGRHADGIADAMVEGPTLRELIHLGWLTDYRIYAPPSDIDVSDVPLTDGGDFSYPKLRAAVHRSGTLVGDVVQHYGRLARGKLGITFAVDVQAAIEFAAAFRAAGVPAEVITGDTPDALRADIMRRFRRREILQLTNCDLLGEGVDVPAVEVVSLARHTESFPLFAQQCGRALRPMDGKTHATIIDHVGNVARHAVVREDPHAGRLVIDICYREWTLDRRDRRGRSKPTDVIPLRTCLNPVCMAVFERVRRCCPECGWVAVPAARSTPEQVDGDLAELDPRVLAQLQGEIVAINGAAAIPYGAAPEVAGAIKRRHWERQEAQRDLRQAIALWGGWQTLQGRDVGEAQRRFFHTYGVDVGTAQTLGSREAGELRQRVSNDLTRRGIVPV